MKFPLIIALIVASFSTFSQSSKKLMAIQFKTIGETNKDSVFVVSTTYFEINITSVNKGEFYIATKDIEKPQVGKQYRSITIALIGDDKKPKHFKTTTDFLNYMDSYNYEMKDQIKNKFGASYTFKKKP